MPPITLASVPARCSSRPAVTNHRRRDYSSGTTDSSHRSGDRSGGTTLTAWCSKVEQGAGRQHDELKVRIEYASTYESHRAAGRVADKQLAAGT